MTEGAAGGAAGDCLALYDLFAAYGALIDAAEFDAWLLCLPRPAPTTSCRARITNANCRAGLVYCDSRAMLEDRIRALREANKYNIHTDRHLIGLPRLTGEDGNAKLVEAPFAVYQTDQEGETRLFATGLYRDRIVVEAGGLRFRDKLVLLDTFAVPSLLATPL
jgi:anthranilate 1,2-dioxygenase small subunit